VTADGLSAIVIVLAAFCLLHAWSTRGMRPALLFLAIAVLTSWAFEEAGVVTGLVYGSYRYTSALGPWVGSVPVLIPLAWFALAYATFTVVDIVGRWTGTTSRSADRLATLGPVPPRGGHGGRGRLVGLALIAAGLMAAWDLALDPVLSGPAYRAWTWGTGPAGVAVPLQNSLGWVATAFSIYVLYGWAARRGHGADTGDVADLGSPPAAGQASAVAAWAAPPDAASPARTAAAVSARMSVPAGPAMPPRTAEARNASSRCSGRPG
jgi:uncharacterized membrane protein